MNVNPLGSSAVLVLAAVLWFVYLIPTWLRRREYLATERNAVRLQQTLRIMAETAQVPREVHAESTARSVAAQQRILRKEQQVEQVISKAQEVLAARAAGTQARRSPADDHGSGRTATRCRPSAVLFPRRHLTRALDRSGGGGRRDRARRVRQRGSARDRSHRRCGVAGAARPDGPGGALTQGAGAHSHPGADRAIPRRPTSSSLSGKLQPRTGWMPVPLPKPLYLSAPSPWLPAWRGASVSSANCGRQRRKPSKPFARHTRGNVTPIIRGEATNRRPAASRDGAVDELDASVTDLDAVLRRRRAVGYPGSQPRCSRYVLLAPESSARRTRRGSSEAPRRTSHLRRGE